MEPQKCVHALVRKQGPIRRGARDSRQWPTPSLDYNFLWLWVPAFVRRDDEAFVPGPYRPTRFNSAVNASSASASITPPHSVMRSGITMRFAGG